MLHCFNAGFQPESAAERLRIDEVRHLRHLGQPRLDVAHTPEQGSWLNRKECEEKVLEQQRRRGRIAGEETHPWRGGA